MPKIIENPRQVILEHARDILYTEGYEKLNMRTVAKTSGVATGTIYNYFPTKQHLIIDMMVEYWEDFLRQLDRIDSTEEDFFNKLRKIYLLFTSFFNTFREVWLKMNTGRTSDFPKEGQGKRRDFTERLTRRLGEIIARDLESRPEDFHLPLSSYDLSKFILQNLMMMSHMEQLEYDAFEVLLRKLVK